MKSSLALVALLGLVASSYAQLVHYEDDGQWKPHLDGSALGSGNLQWLGADLDDGQWKPHLDNSLAGHGLLAQGVVAHGLVGHHLLKRSVFVNANALPVPADTLEVALAKQAQLVQQHTEGTRNVLGGGVPLHLPADTPEVALGKQAHAVAHEHQKVLTSGLPVAHVAAPFAHVAAPVAYSGLHPLFHRLYKRSVFVNANALPVPADTLEVALAKQAQLVQQHTEGTRNVLGGGVPLHLPADTPEVALGKQAHAVAHEHQKALTNGLPVAHVASVAHVAPVAHVAAPVAYSGLHPFGYGLHHGLRAFW